MLTTASPRTHARTRCAHLRFSISSTSFLHILDIISIYYARILLYCQTQNYYSGGSLNEDEFRALFQECIGKALGTSFAVQVAFLFKKMDTNQDKIVDWDEFCKDSVLRHVLHLYEDSLKSHDDIKGHIVCQCLVFLFVAPFVLHAYESK